MITVRERVEEIIKEQSLDRNRVFEVSYLKYKEIIRKTVDTFIKKDYPHKWYDTQKPETVLYWSNIETRFKKELKYNAKSGDVYSYQNLPNVISKNELVYVFIEDTWNKVWVYEMYADELVKILDELWITDYYVVSKKFKWLVTQDHHMGIHVVGEGINIAKI